MALVQVKALMPVQSGGQIRKAGDVFEIDSALVSKRAMLVIGEQKTLPVALARPTPKPVVVRHPVTVLHPKKAKKG